MNKQKMIDKLHSMSINVIPLKPYSKEPITEWKKYQNEMYTGPFADNSNLGVVCGAISNNLFVLDLDDISLFDEFKEYHDKTFIVKTGSRGYHIYFRTSGFLPNNKKFDDRRGRHIDCKAEGGYVLGPGSIHPDTKREYVVLYDRPIMTIEPKIIRDKLADLGFNIQGRSIEEIGQGVKEGGRNDAMFKYTCYLIREKQLYDIPLEEEMSRVNQKNVPPLSPTELKLIIQQALRYEGKNIKPVKELENLEEIAKKEEEANVIKKVKMQDITPQLEGKMIEFNATIMAVGERMTYTKEAECECKECSNPKTVQCDVFHMFEVPFCPKHKSYFVIHEETKKTAYIQQLRIQEFFEDARNNSPIEFDAEITDENVGEAFMNDRMTFVAKFRSFPPKKEGYNHIVFEIISMKPLEQHEGCMPTPEEVERWKSNPNIYKYVVDSIAPELYIQDEIVESGMLAVTGGMSLNGKRSLIHLGLIGDAQLGKSEYLKFIHKMIPGSGLTVGRQATGPGLTIGMHKMYNGMMVPKAGFLPSHTGKPVVIDEADKLKMDDLDYILECMEQGTASQAKTGSGGGQTLPAQCPVLIGGNPIKGKFNPRIGIMENFNFSAPFLSRLDILWLMVDPNDPEHDDIVRKHIREFDASKYMSMEELQRYFTYVRTIKVSLPKEFEVKIDELHKKMRPLNKADGIPIGWRQYYGLNRLVTACAALHLRDTVCEEDFKIVENIITQSLLSLKMDINKGTVEDPMVTKKDKKSTLLLEAWNECLDEDHTVDKDEFLRALATKVPFYNLMNVMSIWVGMEKQGRVQMDKYQRWKLIG